MMKTHRLQRVRLDLENTPRNKMKMKKLFAVSAIGVSVFTAQEIAAQQVPFDMTEINEKLELVIGKKIHQYEDAVGFPRLRRDPDFMVIENKCKTDWSGIIDNFEAIEGGEEAQKLVVSALQELDAGDYMSAIEKLVTRFEAGNVGKPVILKILSPHGRMQAFLADNHAHARVTAALNKIKAKAGDDTEMTSLIDDHLSGEIKTGMDEIREDFAGTGYGNIPQILLPE